MTFGEMLDQLNAYAQAVDRNSLVRINGEYVDELRLVQQFPLVDVPTESGIRELRPNKTRPCVFDFLANGREAPRLPVDVLK